MSDERERNQPECVARHKIVVVTAETPSAAELKIAALAGTHFEGSGYLLGQHILAIAESR